MFERVISSILTRLLGEYVEDSTFNAESVKLGIWRGEENENSKTAVFFVQRTAVSLTTAANDMKFVIKT